MRIVLSLLLVTGFSVLLKADDSAMSGKMNDPKAKIQMHEHMAEMHTKAAACLKSGKTEAECHEAMMTECKAMKGDMDCPMMGDMAKMHKHMHGKMKKDSADTVPADDHSAHH